jgi:putative membrane protein
MNIALIPLADSWGMHGDVGAGWMVVMMFLMVLFWAALIFGIVWLIRRPNGPWWGGRRETSSEILDRRFAEGEISAEDYAQRKEVISGPTRGSTPASAT